MSPQSWIEHLTTTLLNYLPRLISAGVILLFSFVGAIIVRKVVGRRLLDGYFSVPIPQHSVLPARLHMSLHSSVEDCWPWQCRGCTLRL